MKQRSDIVYSTFSWCLMLVMVLAAGCERGPQAQGRQRPTPEVSTVTVESQSIMLTTELPGRTSAYSIAEIRPQVSGIILKRLFTEGSDVSAGQVLYQIDPALYQAALDNAQASLVVAKKAVDRAKAALKAGIADKDRLQANLELARKNQTRYEDSFKDKIVSAVQRDQVVTEVKMLESGLMAAEAQVESNKGAVASAEAAIDQAQAAVATARINLGYCRVAAPIDGRIGRSNVTEGAIVTAYQPVPLATIQQLDPIYADVPQSTAELLRLKHSDVKRDAKGRNQVRLILEDDSAYPLEGTLQFSDVTVDPTTGSVILRAVFPNPDHTLLPGMFVRTIIREGVKEKALLVPQQGVSRDHKGNPMALIVDSESKVAFRMLTLERAIGDQWLVSSGLAPGDRVIVEGMQMLRPGTPVKAVAFNPDAAAQGAGKLAGAPKDGGA